VVYPNPGKYVQFGGAFVGGNTGPPTVLSPCNFDETENITVTGRGTTVSGNIGGHPPSSSSGTCCFSIGADLASVSSQPSTVKTAGNLPDASAKSTNTTFVTSNGTATFANFFLYFFPSFVLSFFFNAYV